MVYPEESHLQYKILDSNNDKPDLEEVDKKKSDLFPHQRVNLKDIIVKYNAFIQGTVGKYTGLSLNIPLKPKTLPLHGEYYRSPFDYILTVK